MATKDNTKEVKKEALNDPERTPDDLVEVMIPATSDDPRTYEWVSINGHSWSIPKDEYVKVPRKVAEVIQNKQRMEKLNRDIKNAGTKNLGDF